MSHTPFLNPNAVTGNVDRVKGEHRMPIMREETHRWFRLSMVT